MDIFSARPYRDVCSVALNSSNVLMEFAFIELKVRNGICCDIIAEMLLLLLGELIE